MGIHFDALVRFTKDNRKVAKASAEPIGNVKRYLEDIIRSAALFEFPTGLDNTQYKKSMDEGEYIKYVRDYFDFSEQNGKFFGTPFKITAVEDPGSVFIMDNLSGSKYTLIRANMGRTRDSLLGRVTFVTCGTVTLSKPDRVTGVVAMSDPKLLFCGEEDPAIRCSYGYEYDLEGLSKQQEDIAARWVASIVYIMDPTNFIIRTNRERGRGGRKLPLLTSMNRARYMAMHEQAANDLFRDRTPNGLFPPRLVRGHQRGFYSDKFVRMKGKTILIEQYCTGNGHLECDGLHYTVMIKTPEGKVVPYDSIAKSDVAQPSATKSG
jgi:hypothetical protein